MGGSGMMSTVIYFIKRLIRRYMDDDVGAMAAESTYYFILGLIPFMIFLVNVVLFFAAPQMDLVFELLSYLPESMEHILRNYVARIISGRSTIWMIGGLAGALWSSSQGVNALIRATDKAFFNNRDCQSWLKINAKSLIFTLLITFAMLLSLIIIVFANAIVYAVADFFQLSELFMKLWKISRFTIPFVTLTLVMALFYQLAPKAPVSRWKRVVAASFIVTLLFLLSTYGYGYYVLHISNMGVTYGSLVGLIVLFIWLRFAALFIIMGGEMVMAWDDTVQMLALPPKK
ncbi:MAG: YihY/virulence factor BrkB family protein [Dialister sp.]|nr:YihY/virulence factor BrkB family protein [Dialister sp.]